MRASPRSITEPGIDGCEGWDGNYYVHISNDSMNDTILSVAHDGSIRWKYSDNATLRLWADCNDGTTILRRDNGSDYTTSDGFVASPMTLPQKLMLDRLDGNGPGCEGHVPIELFRLPLFGSDEQWFDIGLIWHIQF